MGTTGAALLGLLGSFFNLNILRMNFEKKEEAKKMEISHAGKVAEAKIRQYGNMLLLSSIIFGPLQHCLGSFRDIRNLPHLLQLFDDFTFDALISAFSAFLSAMFVLLVLYPLYKRKKESWFDIKNIQ